MKRTLYLILLAAWLPLVLAMQDAPLAPQPVIAGTVTPAAIPSIDGPDQVDPGKPAWYRVAGVPDGASVAFLPTPLLDTSPGRIVQGNAMFWVGSPGEYTITALVIDWEARLFTPITKQVTVAGDVNPPIPPVPPTPVPGDRWVVIVSESRDRTPQEAATLATLRRWLTEQKVQWRIIDPTTEAAWMEPHAAKLKEAGVVGTALVVYVPASDSQPGAYLAVEPLPGRSQEAIARIEEALK